MTEHVHLLLGKGTAHEHVVIGNFVVLDDNSLPYDVIVGTPFLRILGSAIDFVTNQLTVRPKWWLHADTATSFMLPISAAEPYGAAAKPAMMFEPAVASPQAVMGASSHFVSCAAADDACTHSGSSSSTASSSRAPVEFDVKTVHELTDVLSGALSELPSGQALLSAGRFCQQFHTMVSMVLFLRCVAHALTQLDPLNPKAGQPSSSYKFTTLGQVERLVDQCVAMSGLCLAELEALVQGLPTGGADPPALLTFKAHLQACVDDGFLTVSPALAERSAPSLLYVDSSGVVPEWPVEDWSVCGVCGVHVYAHETHAHASSKDTYDGSECARLSNQYGKGKRLDILSGEVNELRKVRLSAKQSALAAAAASHPVVPESDLAIQVQQLHERMAAMGMEMHQLKEACGAAEHRASYFEHAFRSAEAQELRLLPPALVVAKGHEARQVVKETPPRLSTLSTEPAGPLHIKLRPEYHDQPIFTKQRPHSVAELDVQDKKCKEMLEAGIIVPSQQTRFASEVVIAAKKNAITGAWDDTRAFVDDILIFSKTPEEHIVHVRKVLEALNKVGIKLHPDKSLFACDVVEYLGFNVSKYGLTPHHAKIAAIEALKTPSNVSEVRSVLGLMSYYRRFIQNFSTHAAPLNALLGKGVPFEWGSSQQAAFDQLKEALTTEGRALKRVDPNLPLVLYCDWSKQGIGAVLAQIDSEGLEMLLRNGVKVVRYLYCDKCPRIRRIAAHRMHKLSDQYPALLLPAAYAEAFTALPQDVWRIGSSELVRAGVLDGGQWFVVAGFECQDLSPAGKGKGIDGEHSRTFYALK
eukprot:gene15236-biopygen2480